MSYPSRCLPRRRSAPRRRLCGPWPPRRTDVAAAHPDEHVRNRLRLAGLAETWSLATGTLGAPAAAAVTLWVLTTVAWVWRSLSARRIDARG
jgi:hypothetical protein